jgi:membrane protease YdiL (CAAX protease family)
MRKRLPRLAFLVVALAAWWLGYNRLDGAVQRWVGFSRVTNEDTQTVLGHWFMWQLPAVLVCVAVWLVGQRLGYMPSFVRSLRLGGSPRRVLTTGLIASVVLLVITFGLGAALGGEFGFHPYVPKMLGDLVSNMYEEIVFRGLVFCAFYGVAAAATFPLVGSLSRAGLVAGTIGSCVAFASGHTQYPLALRAVLGVIAIVFVWPWVRARSLWAPYIPHTLGDIIGDTLLKL